MNLKFSEIKDIANPAREGYYVDFSESVIHKKDDMILVHVPFIEVNHNVHVNDKQVTLFSYGRFIIDDCIEYGEDNELLSMSYPELSIDDVLSYFDGHNTESIGSFFFNSVMNKFSFHSVGNRVPKKIVEQVFNAFVKGSNEVFTHFGYFE